jgi:hypothetical protein
VPYERSEDEFHCNMSVSGKVSRYGSRVLSEPTRVEFTLHTPSQDRSGDTRKMLPVRCTVYDMQNRPRSSDYVQVTGLPQVKENRLSIMAFGKDVEILARWIPKEKK